MDPISIITLSAAVGGATGKFVEKAWDSGEKWIQSYFKDHNEIAQKYAQENTMEFLSELANRIKRLEEEKEVSKKKIIDAQNHPDFSIILQKAMLASAQTNNKNKHVVLARLVSERLKTKSESILALSSKMACDAVSYMTANQMKLLGFTVNLYNRRPNPYPPENINSNSFQGWMNNWIEKTFMPYEELIVRRIDIIHLISISCLNFKISNSINLNQVFSKEHQSLEFSFENFHNQNLRETMAHAWMDGLNNVELTTVGQIIGVSASDYLCNTKTGFEDWE